MTEPWLRLLMTLPDNRRVFAGAQEGALPIYDRNNDPTGYAPEVVGYALPSNYYRGHMVPRPHLDGVYYESGNTTCNPTFADQIHIVDPDHIALSRFGKPIKDVKRSLKRNYPTMSEAVDQMSGILAPSPRQSWLVSREMLKKLKELDMPLKIEKMPPRKKGERDSRTIVVSIPTHDLLMKQSESTGRSVRWLADAAIAFAFQDKKPEGSS